MQNFEEQAIYPGAELYLIDQFMQVRNFQAPQWLLGTGLDHQDIAKPNTLVSLKQFDIIYRNIYRLNHEADIGLQLGKALNLSRWGMVALAMMTERTVGYALAAARDYQALMRSRFILIPKRQDSNIRIGVSTIDTLPFPVTPEFGYEILIGTTQRQISDLRSKPFYFDRIELNYPKPSHHQRYQYHFQCEVKFGCDQSALWLPASALEQALPLTNPLACAQARALCLEEVERIQGTLGRDIKWQVKHALGSESPPPNLEQVAQRLNVSPRTLRRHLNNADCSFRKLHSEYCLQLALHLLSETHSPLLDIAERSGFTNIGSFREAFRRRTGMSPSSYRRQFHNKQSV